MQGVIEYIDKEDNEKRCYFSGVRDDESPENVLDQRQIEYKKILGCWAKMGCQAKRD